jgi:uncharacterized ion transporter superfamily protein YfcC
MGKEGFLGSKWTTIILAVVLVIMAAILVWIFKTGGFDRFRPKRKPSLPPSKISMNHNPTMPGDQANLRTIDSRLTAVADLSWKKLA